MALGEAMLRLTAPRGERLESAANLHAYVAGAEANVARTLARLGLPAVWLSAVPTSPVGERILRALRARRRRHLIRRASEQGTRRAVLRRAGRSAAGDAGVVRPRGVGLRAHERARRTGARRARRSRSCPGLRPRSAPARESSPRALPWPHGPQGRPALHRRELPQPPVGCQSARRGLSGLLAQADVVVCAERDARVVLEATGEAQEIVRDIAERWAPRVGRRPHAPRAWKSAAGGGAGDRAAGGRGALRARQLRRRRCVSRRFAVGIWIGAGAADALKAGATLASMKCTLAGDVASISAAELALAADSPRDTAIFR